MESQLNADLPIFFKDDTHFTGAIRKGAKRTGSWDDVDDKSPGVQVRPSNFSISLSQRWSSFSILLVVTVIDGGFKVQSRGIGGVVDWRGFRRQRRTSSQNLGEIVRRAATTTMIVRVGAHKTLD